MPAEHAEHTERAKLSFRVFRGQFLSGFSESRTMTQHDTAFQISAANVRFGPGVTREVGMDLRDLGARRTLVLMDPALRSLPVGETVVEALREAAIEFELFDRIAVEPTDRSFAEAISAATEGRFDAF